MGRRSKTRASYVRSKRKKYHDTQIELVVRELLKSVGFDKQEYYKKVSYDEEGRHYDFEPDIILPGKIAILVDGPHHFTATFQRKDRWQNKAYASVGWKVIRVPYTILKTKELQNYAIREIQRAIISQDNIEVIEG